MISMKQVKIARVNWIKASVDLNFKIVTPYQILVNGRKDDAFAFLPGYGSPNGTLVNLVSAPEFKVDVDIVKLAKELNCHYSFINIESCLEYNKYFFQETLEDWMKYQEDNS
jgi:hypothetical protein